ncbi:MAG: hypothetical protein KKB50_03975 [Planctomycetes bacterium]|nr:hypothetical protein [Planctomycetota bacterium]
MRAGAFARAAAVLAVMAMVAVAVGQHGLPDVDQAAQPAGAQSSATLAPGLEVVPSWPHVGHCENSGCLQEPGYEGPCELDDEIILTVHGNDLKVLHANATYNCCLDDITITLSVQGDVIQLFEEELLTNPCWCVCCFNVDASVRDLEGGRYTVEFWWFDTDTEELRCHVEEIVIPDGPTPTGGDALRDGQGGIPGNPGAGQNAETLPDLRPSPYIVDYSNSGCLGGEGSISDFCDPDEFAFTVGPHALHVLHHNVTYNCCLDEISQTVTVDGRTLILNEEEVLTDPCWCVCCFDAEVTVGGLASGPYTVEYWWYDYETGQYECHIAHIVIP